jgi:hypothetical protein
MINKINKKGFLTRDFVIAGIFSMGIIAIMILMVQGVADNYDNPDLVDPDFSKNYDKLENITSDVEVMLNTTRSGSGLSFRGAFDVTFGAAFTAIQLVFGILGLMGGIVENLVVDFDLEREPVILLLIVGTSIIAVTLIFVWLSSISRGKI